MRETVGATYAVLLGLDFPDERGIEEELATHKVSLWTLEDLISILECQLHHPIKWSTLPTLFAPGRSADAIAAFRADHVHGPYSLARLAMRYAMEEGLAYQRSLATEAGAPANALLTADSITLLVNQRMAREGMIGPVFNRRHPRRNGVSHVGCFALAKSGSDSGIMIETSSPRT